MSHYVVQVPTVLGCLSIEKTLLTTNSMKCLAAIVRTQLQLSKLILLETQTTRPSSSSMMAYVTTRDWMVTVTVTSMVIVAWVAKWCTSMDDLHGHHDRVVGIGCPSMDGHCDIRGYSDRGVETELPSMDSDSNCDAHRPWIL